MKLSEHQLQSWAITYLRFHKILCFAVPNAGKRSGALGRYCKNEGLLAGVADVVIVLPKGRVVFVEFKVGSNKQEPEQVDFQKQLDARDHDYRIWRTQKEAVDFIEELKNAHIQKKKAES